MPQVFVALRCFSCETFQVQQEKKTNKWKCTMCGAAQSVRKIYARGFTGDCRAVVQDLNCRRLAGEFVGGDDENGDCVDYEDGNQYGEYVDDDGTTNEERFQQQQQQEPRVSKWAAFLPAAPDERDGDAQGGGGDALPPGARIFTDRDALAHEKKLQRKERSTPYARRPVSTDAAAKAYPAVPSNSSRQLPRGSGGNDERGESAAHAVSSSSPRGPAAGAGGAGGAGASAAGPPAAQNSRWTKFLIP